jgi:hypothetical protein
MSGESDGVEIFLAGANYTPDGILDKDHQELTLVEGKFCFRGLLTYLMLIIYIYIYIYNIYCVR